MTQSGAPQDHFGVTSITGKHLPSLQEDARYPPRHPGMASWGEKLWGADLRLLYNAKRLPTPYLLSLLDTSPFQHISSGCFVRLSILFVL